jgi:hypothetical protein
LSGLVPGLQDQKGTTHEEPHRSPPDQPRTVPFVLVIIALVMLLAHG